MGRKRRNISWMQPRAQRALAFLAEHGVDHLGPVVHPPCVIHLGAVVHPPCVRHHGAVVHSPRVDQLEAIVHHLGAMVHPPQFLHQGAIVHPRRVLHEGAESPDLHRPLRRRPPWTMGREREPDPRVPKSSSRGVDGERVGVEASSAIVCKLIVERYPSFRGAARSSCRCIRLRRANVQVSTIARVSFDRLGKKIGLGLVYHWVFGKKEHVSRKK
ncbi:hypothetical protein EJB05_27825, partial [Eragrostis curvula]